MNTNIYTKQKWLDRLRICVTCHWGIWRRLDWRDYGEWRWIYNRRARRALTRLRRDFLGAQGSNGYAVGRPTAERRWCRRWRRRRNTEAERCQASAACPAAASPVYAYLHTYSSFFSLPVDRIRVVVQLCMYCGISQINLSSEMCTCQ